MDVVGIYEVQTNLMDTVIGLQELWLGGTFAVIVAFHAGRESINKTILWLGCILYAVASFTIGIRYYGYVATIYNLTESIVAAGEQPLPFPMEISVANLIATAFMFLLGTFGAIAFAINQYVKKELEGI